LPFPEKSEVGRGYIVWDELSLLISHRVPEAIFLWANLIMTTMVGIEGWHGWRRYLAELWIMKSGKIGEADIGMKQKCGKIYL
jgi:hypothetical protein